MPKVELPDGTIDHFPEDMPIEEIEAILQARFPPDAPEPVCQLPQKLAPGETYRHENSSTITHSDEIGRYVVRDARGTAQGFVHFLPTPSRWPTASSLRHRLVVYLKGQCQSQTGLSVRTNCLTKLIGSSAGTKGFADVSGLPSRSRSGFAIAGRLASPASQSVTWRVLFGYTVAGRSNRTLSAS